METEALYDRLGGSDGIETVVDEFYDRMLDDERPTANWTSRRLTSRSSSRISGRAWTPVASTTPTLAR